MDQYQIGLLYEKGKFFIWYPGPISISSVLSQFYYFKMIASFVCLLFYAQSVCSKAFIVGPPLTQLIAKLFPKCTNSAL